MSTADSRKGDVARSTSGRSRSSTGTTTSRPSSSPAKKIGFDIAVADRDIPETTEKGLALPRSERSAWIYWGP